MKKVLYVSSITPAVEHMRNQYQWNSDGPIPRPESISISDQILSDAQASFPLVSETRMAFFRKLLLQFVCTDCLPLNVVERDAFEISNWAFRDPQAS
jgi:hypothetical protein